MGVHGAGEAKIGGIYEYSLRHSSSLDGVIPKAREH
jgi:hypothetical protein